MASEACKCSDFAAIFIHSGAGQLHNYYKQKIGVTLRIWAGKRHLRNQGETTMNEPKKAVVTVLGYDRKGIIAKVSAVLYECDANIVDISQTVLSGLFNMVLVADISSPDCAFDQLSARLNHLGEELGLQIRVQRSEIFEAMHQI